MTKRCRLGGEISMRRYAMPVPRLTPVPSRSESSLSRREVLRLGVAVPAVFGLSALLGCRRGDGGGGGAGGGGQGGGPARPPIAQDPSAAPDWWEYFVSKAKDAEYGEPVVVLRIPASAQARAALGTILVDMTDRGSIDERLLMMGTKVGCLTD